MASASGRATSICSCRLPRPQEHLRTLTLALGLLDCLDGPLSGARHAGRIAGSLLLTRRPRASIRALGDSESRSHRAISTPAMASAVKPCVRAQAHRGKHLLPWQGDMPCVLADDDRRQQVRNDGLCHPCATGVRFAPAAQPAFALHRAGALSGRAGRRSGGAHRGGRVAEVSAARVRRAQPSLHSSLSRQLCRDSSR